MTNLMNGRAKPSRFRLAILLPILLALAGCASQAPQRTGEAPSAGGTTPIKQTKKKPKAGSESNACAGGGFSLYEEGNARIAGDELAVYTGRSKQTKSLCEVLQDTGKPVAIFQFAGVFCISCQVEAKHLRQEIEASPYGKYIEHVVVLTDFFAEYEDAQFQGFMTNYAPKSIAVYDEATLWKYFSESSSSPNRATILAMDLDMNATVYNREGEEGNIMGAAERLAKAYKARSSKQSNLTAKESTP